MLSEQFLFNFSPLFSNMTILITNDDGYTEGLRVLLEVAKKIGIELHHLKVEEDKV